MVYEIKDAFNNPAVQRLPECSRLERFVYGESAVCETRAVLPAPPRAAGAAIRWPQVTGLKTCVPWPPRGCLARTRT